MELAQIKILLKKYDAGETSLEEEQTLRTYFLNNEVSADLQHYKLLFAFTGKQRNLKSEAPLYVNKANRKNINWSAIAAVLVIAFGVFYFFQPHINLNGDDLGSTSQEEINYQQTKETLQMVSSFMNKGTEDLGYLKEFNNTKNKIIQID